MKINRILLGRRVSLSLLSYDMKENRLVNIFNIIQYINKMIQFMPLYRAKVFKVEGLKQYSRRNKGLKGFF